VQEPPQKPVLLKKICLHCLAHGEEDTREYSQRIPCVCAEAALHLSYGPIHIPKQNENSDPGEDGSIDGPKSRRMCLLPSHFSLRRATSLPLLTRRTGGCNIDKLQPLFGNSSPWHPPSVPRYSGGGAPGAAVSAGRAEPTDPSYSEAFETNLLSARHADAGQ